MVQSLQKLTPGFKKHMRNLNNFKQAVHIPKSWNLMGFFPKKNPSAKILYAEDLLNINFNYLCENSPNYLCHFWNHKSFFTTQLLCIFLAQTLHTFYKSSPSKCKFSDFPLLRLNKVHQISHVIFQMKSQFFLKVLNLFSVSWEIILLYFFNWNFICSWQT